MLRKSVERGSCFCLAIMVLCGVLSAQKVSKISAKVYYDRGLVKLQTGELDEALKDFNKAIELRPNYARAFMHRGQCHDELLEFEKAFADLGNAVRLNPRLDFAFKLRADLYAKVGKFKEAISDYTRVLKLVPGDHDALSARADAYREIGENKLAEADERAAEKEWELLKDEPGTISPTRVVLTVPFRRYRPKLLTEEELVNSYIRSIGGNVELLPDTEEKIRKLAAEEVEKYTKILLVNPNFAGAYFERANNQVRLDEFASAIADYSKAIGLDPNQYIYFNNRGIAHAKTGNYERAFADFAKAMSIEPNDLSSHYNLGLILLNKGLFEQSANILTGYIEKRTNDMKAFQLRALAYRKLGKTAEAEADEKTAKRLEGQN